MEILYEMPGFLFEDSYSHQWVRLSMLWEQVSLPVMILILVYFLKYCLFIFVRICLKLCCSEQDCAVI